MTYGLFAIIKYKIKRYPLHSREDPWSSHMWVLFFHKQNVVILLAKDSIKMKKKIQLKKLILKSEWYLNLNWILHSFYGIWVSFKKTNSIKKYVFIKYTKFLWSLVVMVSHILNTRYYKSAITLWIYLRM